MKKMILLLAFAGIVTGNACGMDNSGKIALQKIIKSDSTMGSCNYKALGGIAYMNPDSFKKNVANVQTLSQDAHIFNAYTLKSGTVYLCFARGGLVKRRRYSLFDSIIPKLYENATFENLSFFVANDSQFINNTSETIVTHNGNSYININNNKINGKWYIGDITLYMPTHWTNWALAAVELAALGYGAYYFGKKLFWR